MNATHPITDNLGRIVATPAALAVLTNAGRTGKTLLTRHVRGDWGEVDDEDWKANNEATQNGSRILSSYTVGTEKVWIITDAEVAPGQRYATTILLPSDY